MSEKPFTTNLSVRDYIAHTSHFTFGDALLAMGYEDRESFNRAFRDRKIRSQAIKILSDLKYDYADAMITRSKFDQNSDQIHQCLF